MPLQPSEPPGHAKRKLRAYVKDIARLRAAGYTLRAVHQALVDAGVKVAWATVQREAARLESIQPASRLQKKPKKLPIRVASSSHADPPEKKNSDSVEQFFQQHNANPLFKRKASKP